MDMCPKCKENEINTSSGYCRQCRNANAREYGLAHRARMHEIAKKCRDADPDKEYFRHRKWVKKNPRKINEYSVRYFSGKGKLRARAVSAVHNAVRDNRLVKPEVCSLAPKCVETKIQAHHYRGYSKENWLTVMWLCRLHHLEIHGKRNRIEESCK